MAWKASQGRLVDCPHCGRELPALFHSSCRKRARWSRSERAAFKAADARAEALEHESGAWRLGVFVPVSTRRPCATPGCPRSTQTVSGVCSDCREGRVPNPRRLTRYRRRLAAKGITLEAA